MISSAVFVAALALQKKFPLSSKLSMNPGSMPKTYTCFVDLEKAYDRFLVKRFEERCGSTVLMAACFWPSSHCIPA